MGLLKMMWGWLKGLAQLLVAPAAKIRALPGIRPILRWILHFVLLALVLAGLGALNYFLDLGQAVRAPRPWLGQVWLPLLFLLLYGLGWLVWWMIHLLSAEEAPSPFPDIDLAWKDACVALEKAGIDPSRLPLFLVLGRSAGQELSVFQAARIPLVVSRAPRELDAPLHVFASEEGVYVTCGGASLLAEYARILTGEESDEEELLPAPAPREKSPPRRLRRPPPWQRCRRPPPNRRPAWPPRSLPPAPPPWPVRHAVAAPTTMPPSSRPRRSSGSRPGSGVSAS